MRNETENKRAITRDQLVTIGDLEQFKTELTKTIKDLLQGSSRAPSKPYLKSNEVRKLLNISAGKLLNLRTSGILPYTRLGGVIYYDEKHIHNLFTKQGPSRS